MSVSQYSSSPTMFISPPDNLDQFVDYLLSSKPRIRFAVIQQFATEVKHPVYHHLLKTLDNENAQYVVGYLRSQKMVEVHSFVDKIVAEININL